MEMESMWLMVYVPWLDMEKLWIHTLKCLLDTVTFLICQEIHTHNCVSPVWKILPRAIRKQKHSLKEKYWISVNWPMVEVDWISSSEKLGWIQIHRDPFLSISSTHSARQYFFPWVSSVLINQLPNQILYLLCQVNINLLGAYFRLNVSNYIYIIISFIMFSTTH